MNIYERMLRKTSRFHLIPDEMALMLQGRARLGKWINLKEPRTFSEKLQWLKLHDRNPLYTKLVDKAEVKSWVAERIGWEHVVSTLAVWDSFEQVNFDLLPEKFVLKCTHDSGGLIICSNREEFDIGAARRKIKDSLSRNYFWNGREWPYKLVKPRVLAEEYLESGNSGLTDFKIMCFGGRARCVFTCTGRSEGDLRVDFFDLEWNHLPFTRHYPNADTPPAKPCHFDEMISFAELLSKEIPFVRVDFYEQDDRVLFGEMTFYPGSGFEEFEPEEWDEKLGSLIDITMMD